MLTEEELERYNRQLIIRGFGVEGQEKLKRAKVVIAGAGGLGSPASLYLTAAGVGTIRIVDDDAVELSNLNRQVLHWTEDIGNKKVDSAVEKLERLNPNVKVEAVRETITEKNASRLVDGFDVIVDAMDNLATRLILNRMAIEKNMPLIHGAVNSFEGRAMTIIPGKTACLRCLYRGDVPGEKSPVIGAAPAVIGSIQAMEVIKYIVGIGDLLTDRMLAFDGRCMKFTEFLVKRVPGCEHCGK